MTTWKGILMFGLLWTLSTALRGCLRLYLPSNRAVDWLRTPPELKWALPVALTVTPGYLFCASVCASAVNRGGPGYRNALVLLFFWNAVKFAVMGVLAPITRKATQAQGVGARRVARLQAARERRLTFDPNQWPARGASTTRRSRWSSPGKDEVWRSHIGCRGRGRGRDRAASFRAPRGQGDERLTGLAQATVATSAASGSTTDDLVWRVDARLIVEGAEVGALPGV